VRGPKERRVEFDDRSLGSRLQSFGKGGGAMAARMEEELMEELSYEEEAEGAAEAFEEGEEFEEEEGFEAGEEEFAAEEEWEGAEEEDLGEEFEEEGFEEEGEEEYAEEAAYEDEAALENAMAYALGAEDTDEFFRRAFGALRRVGRAAGRVARRVARTARRVAPVIGRVARAAAPIARLIPHPWARAAAPALSLLGRLRAEGASEEEALEAFAELATYDESAVPIVAGLAARTLVRGQGARMPVAARRRLVRNMGATARGMIRRRGPAAVRALPRIVRSVRRTAAVRRTPLRVAPGIVRRAAARVLRSPRLARRLSRPSPLALRRVRGIRSGLGRGFTLRGPVRITISGAA
jgi:hypothetical protein